jgi:hypothetical protein
MIGEHNTKGKKIEVVEKKDSTYDLLKVTLR